MKNLLKKFIYYIRPKKILNININTLQKSELLQNKLALITGGTSGIGFSIAESFIKAGAYVIITGRTKARLDSAISRLPKGRCSGVIIDNMDVKTFDDKLESILKTINNIGYNHIDILVNNAGVNGKGMPNATVEEWDNIVGTNLKGAFFLSQLFGKYLILNKINGNILNIASASSLRPADSAYSLSKWGLRGLTLGLAKSLGKYGITVNGIAPGPTATPMILKDKDSNLLLERIPLGRYIMPEEIGDMAVILVSDLGRSIMGDIVYMTGGAANLTYDDVRYDFN